MTRDILEMVGEWAQDRVASGEEPPWTYFKLKQFAELAEQLAAGMDAVAPFDPSAKRVKPDAQLAQANIIKLESFRAASKQVKEPARNPESDINLPV